MHAADIQAALKKRRVTQAGIAAKLGVSHNAVSLVISGRSKSQRIATEISRATGIPAQRLFPGRGTP